MPRRFRSIQPLAGEVADQRLGARIGQHPPHLLLQHRRVVQLALRSARSQQLVVGNAAPQEERQPRRQLQVADAMNRSRRRARRIVFSAEDEFRDRPASAGSRPGSRSRNHRARASAVVELEQRLEVRLTGRSPIGAARQRRKDPSRTRPFHGPARWAAGKYPTTAGRVSRIGLRGKDR